MPRSVRRCARNGPHRVRRQTGAGHAGRGGGWCVSRRRRDCSSRPPFRGTKGIHLEQGQRTRWPVHKAKGLDSASGGR